MSLSAALSAEVRVEVVEHGGPTLEPGLVIPVAHGDARFRTFQGCELPQGRQTSVLGLLSSSCLSCPDVVPYSALHDGVPSPQSSSYLASASSTSPAV